MARDEGSGRGNRRHGKGLVSPEQQNGETRHSTPMKRRRLSFSEAIPAEEPASPEASGADDFSASLDVSVEETNNLVALVMRHMLFKNGQHPGVPVRRDELIHLITQTYKKRNLAGLVIEKAQEKFNKGFGIQMKEYVKLPSTKGPSASAPAEVKEYTLETMLPASMIKTCVGTTEKVVENGLAVMVVAIIKVCGGDRVPEETLLNTLRRFGVNHDDVAHPDFGNVRQALEGIVKRRYIQKEKVNGSDGSFVYELSERALDPGFQARFDKFMAKIIPEDYHLVPTPVEQ